MGAGNELMHYGVLGMKWGKRKNPSSAFGKSAEKADKLRRKISKTEVKLDKASNKLTKYNQRGDQDKANRAAAKVNRVGQKLQKRTAKSQKWEKAMSKTFNKTKMSDITQKDLIKGRDYVNMLVKG